jgi:5-methylcytosine-specific restriction endonuclease McrA
MGYEDDIERKRKYQREWLAARRAAWFVDHPKCVNCGGNENLELDHIDSTTKVSHKIWSWSQKRREAELNKCQVLCKKCHLSKSRENGEQPLAREHGNPSKYEHDGCRCPLCTEGHRVYQLAWREKISRGTSAR